MARDMLVHARAKTHLKELETKYFRAPGRRSPSSSRRRRRWSASRCRSWRTMPGRPSPPSTPTSSRRRRRRRRRRRSRGDRRRWLAALGALAARASAGRAADAADEAVVIRPLPSGELLLHANLTVTTDAADLRHLESSARALAELLVASAAAEVHATLATGRWQPDRLGPLRWRRRAARDVGVVAGAARATAARRAPWSRRAALRRACAAHRRRRGGRGGGGRRRRRRRDGAPCYCGRARRPPRWRRSAARLARRAGSCYGRRTRRARACAPRMGGWLALWACSGASGVGRFYGPASPLWPLLSAASYRSLAFDVGVECARRAARAVAAAWAAAGGRGTGSVFSTPLC